MMKTFDEFKKIHITNFYRNSNEAQHLSIMTAR